LVMYQTVHKDVKIRLNPIKFVLKIIFIYLTSITNFNYAIQFNT
jgi:hypothetical protein